MTRYFPWLIPILVIILLAPLTPWLDLSISKDFYKPETGFERSSFILFMYNWAAWPGILVAVISFIVFCFSFYYPQWKRLRNEALIISLTMLIGAGLIVHVILKDHWGRPRPAQVTEFGGSQTFRPFYEPNFFHQTQPAKSFPCGHCSTGFFFFVLALVGFRLRNYTLMISGLILAVGMGLLLSYTRIAMGGHFFSDTMISALIMWLTAYALYRWVPIYEGIE